MRGTILVRQFRNAKNTGRICAHCGWMITIKDWKAGYKTCGNCRDALKGVNVKSGYYPYSDEPTEKTGEM